MALHAGSHVVEACRTADEESKSGMGSPAAVAPGEASSRPPRLALWDETALAAPALGKPLAARLRGRARAHGTARRVGNCLEALCPLRAEIGCCSVPLLLRRGRTHL